MSKISPPFSKGNEFSDGPDLQLLHHPVAMRLDRALAPAQRASDLHTSEHRSRWAAVTSIATKIGCTPQTLHDWVKKAEIDSRKRAGVLTDMAEKLKALERENRELR